LNILTEVMSVANVHQQAIGAYQTQAIMTASRGQLITMAFDGLRKFIKLGANAIDAGDIEAAHHNIVRAQDILVELYSSLDLEKGGEIAANLQKLYDFMYTQLVQANLRKDRALLDQVLAVLQPIRDGWAEAVKLAEQQGGK
jgi:flagellar protein FliS